MTRILLVRHGQSAWNAEGRWQGRADPPLSQLGRLQARHAAARLGEVDVIIASPLQRAFDTARIIADELGVGPVLPEPDLVERDAGEWSGLTRAEIEERWPGWIEAGRRPPGYEDDASVLERATRALARIEREHRGANVVVVCHGGIIYALEGHHGDPVGRIPNLGARRIVHHGSHLELGERLLLVGEDELTVPSVL
ncbi:MAG: histidine phosphatase family protein [Acidimicrobiales bacterium]